jgi:peptidoglycan/LPS O-acetylase OafA/YrhL
MRFIGRISYSLYLWHVVVNFLWHALLFSPTGPMAHLSHHWEWTLLERPARTATSFLLAILSYYLLEKPLIRVGHRLAPPATPGRPELADLPVETPDPAKLAEAQA